MKDTQEKKEMMKRGFTKKFRGKLLLKKIQSFEDKSYVKNPILLNKIWAKIKT